MKEQKLNNQKISATPGNMMIGLLFLLMIAFIISFFSLWANHIQLKSEFESFSKVVLSELENVRQDIRVIDNSVGKMNWVPNGKNAKSKKAPQPVKNEKKSGILPIAAKVQMTELTEYSIPTKVTTHIVADGESLQEICNQYQVDIIDVSELNDIQNPDQLIIGELISIPLK